MPMYRQYTLLAAYNEEAKGSLQNSIASLQLFKERFPDRADANDIDETLSELEGRIELASRVRARADELQKARGFAKDVLALRRLALSLDPGNVLLQLDLSNAVTIAREYIAVTLKTAAQCNAKAQDITPKAIGKTLVALGVTSLPEKVFPSGPVVSTPAGVCSLVGHRKDALEESLLNQWGLEAIESYRRELEETLALDRTIELQDDKHVEGVQYPEFNDRPFMPKGFTRAVSPVSFEKPHRNVPAAPTAPALRVFLHSRFGTLLCWTNRPGAADVFISGVLNRFTVVRATACSAGRDGFIPEFRRLSDGEVANAFVAGLADVLARLEKGEDVTRMPREQVRRTLCFALMEVAKDADESEATWRNSCQMELVSR